jgi:hypothetical protein
MSLLDGITQRRPVLDHDGRSGATLERGILDDGTPVYIKTSDVVTDIGLLLTGDARRELRLWQTGILDGLPAGVGTAVVGIEHLGDRLVTVTRDLGASMLSWDRTLTPDEVRRIFAAITAIHRQHQGNAPPGLVDLATRIGLFSPSRLDAVATANPDLVGAIGRGHELFDELVPDDVADAVHACYADPEPLADAMAAGGTTLLHGDFFLVNVALGAEQVTPLDWGLATAGPAALDLITFSLGAMSNVSMDRHQLLDEARSACRDLVDDETFSLLEFWALMELGWNKALDAIDHPDPAKRATERADLGFWVARARRALQACPIPFSRHNAATESGRN